MESHLLRLSDLIHEAAFYQLRELMHTFFGARTWIMTKDHTIFKFAHDKQPLFLPYSACGCDEGYCLQHVVASLCAECDANKAVTKTTCPATGNELIALPIMSRTTMLGYWLFERADKAADAPGEAYVASAQGLSAPANELVFLQDGLDLKTSVYETLIHYIQEYNQRMIDLTLSRNTFKTFVDACPLYMYICDYHTGEMLMVNRGYADLVGRSFSEILGRPCWTLEKKDATGFCDYCPRKELVDENGKPVGARTYTIYNERYRQWQLCTNQVFEWSHGRLAHIVTIVDITKEHQMEEKLYDLAYYDQRLHLPNRLKLFKDIEELHKQKDGTFPHLIFFNVSGMKHLNDVYGRDTGDELLRVIASDIVHHFGQNGTLYCMTGDEFCFIPTTHDHTTHLLAQEIENRFDKPWAIRMNNHVTSYYCKISISVFCGVGLFAIKELPDLVRRTLDISRETGSIVVYDEKMDAVIRERAALIIQMNHCIRQNMQGFEVHYQPILKVEAKKWMAVEALCRWSVPSLGAVPPSIFIPLAEQNGAIKEIGQWVLETAIRQCKQLMLDAHDGFFVSVNVSAIQIMDKEFASLVKEILTRYDFPAHKLALEVTEESKLIFSDFTKKVIDELVAAGVHLALDDFGTGYSNYDHIRQLPMSFLKTERSFINGIEDDTYLQTFYRCVCDMSHANSIKMIAEGIETAEQMKVTMQNGADYFQGYLFSKPLSAYDLSRSRDQFDVHCPHFAE